MSIIIADEGLDADLSTGEASVCTNVEAVDVSDGIREGPFGGVFWESDLLVLDRVLVDEIVLQLPSRFGCRKCCRRGGVGAAGGVTAAASKKLANPGGLSLWLLLLSDVLCVVERRKGGGLPSGYHCKSDGELPMKKRKRNERTEQVWSINNGVESKTRGSKKKRSQNVRSLWAGIA